MKRSPCPLKSGAKKIIFWWVVVLPGLEKRVLQKHPRALGTRQHGPSVERWLAVFISLQREMSCRDLPGDLFPGYQTHQSSVSHWEKDWGYGKKKKKKSGDLVLVCALTKQAVWLWASFSEFFIWKCPHGLKDSPVMSSSFHDTHSRCLSLFFRHQFSWNVKFA